MTTLIKGSPSRSAPLETLPEEQEEFQETSDVIYPESDGKPMADNTLREIGGKTARVRD